MSKKYSHSKLSTFEQCPLKYKYKYIDKIIPEIEKTIEAVLGKAVHSTLEWLYHEKQKTKKIPTIEQIISYYAEKWQEEHTENTLIVKQDQTQEDYFNKGVEFILNYYKKHHPFEDNTIALEKQIQLILDEEKNIHIIGFIDRLVHNLEKDELEIHDYKTGNSMPRKEAIENDRQLALYSMAIKQEFGQNKNVCLIWHYLAHDLKICIRKTQEQLEQLKREILELIEQIEQTKTFHPYITRLCDWCEYKDICTAWENSPKKSNEKQLTLDEEQAEKELEISE